MNNEALVHASDVLETSAKALMAGGGTADAGMPMPDNPLDGFRNGCLLDLRVRLAMELLVHSNAWVYMRSPDARQAYSPKFAATAALDTATELFDLAESRGLVKPLGEVDEHLMAHIRRQVVYQIETQKEQQRQAEQSGRIAKAVHGAFRGN